VLLAIVVGVGCQYVQPGALGAVLRRFQRLPVLAQAATVAACLMIVNTLGPEGVAPFIYFRF
jgi:hypothetical protein